MACEFSRGPPSGPVAWQGEEPTRAIGREDSGELKNVYRCVV